MVLESRQQTPVLPWNDVLISVLQLKENRQSNRLLPTGNVWITAVLSSLTIDKQNCSWKVSISKHRGSRCSSITDKQLNFWKRKSVQRRRLSITKCTPAGPTSPQPRRFLVADDRRAKFETLLRKGLLCNKIDVLLKSTKIRAWKAMKICKIPSKSPFIYTSIQSSLQMVHCGSYPAQRGSAKSSSEEWICLDSSHLPFLWNNRAARYCQAKLLESRSCYAGRRSTSQSARANQKRLEYCPVA